MAVAYISDAYSDSTYVATAPSDNQSGDLLLLLVLSFAAGSGSPAEVITPPAGWTLQADDEVTTYQNKIRRLFLFTKFTTGSEPASYTFTGDGTGEQDPLAVIIRVRTAHSTSPINAIGVYQYEADPPDSVSPFDVMFPSIVTSIDGCLLLAVVFAAGTTSASFSSPPTGYTERIDTDSRVASFDKSQPAAGGTGTATAVRTINADVLIGYHVAIAPVATAGVRYDCNAL